MPNARASWLFSALLIFSVGCAGSLVERSSKTLSTALAATSAARDQFVSWDETYQLEIVAEATTREEGEKALSAYRVKRSKVLKAFTATYMAISSAAAILPLVEKGTAKDAELETLLVDALKAALHVKNAFDELQGG